MWNKFRKRVSELFYKEKKPDSDSYEQLLGLISNYGKEVEQCLTFASPAYDGARQNRLTNDWTTANTTLSSNLKNSLNTLVARSSNLCSNNSVAGSILTTLINNVIGTGIEVYSSVRDSNGDPWDVVNEYLDDLWEEYVDNWSVQKDVNFNAHQEVIFRDLFVNGSSMVQVSSSPYKSDTIPIRNNVFSSSRLDSMRDDPAPTYSEMPNVKRTLFGINLTKYSAHDSFWIQGESKPVSGAWLKMHFFKRESEQIIGIPAMSPTMKYLWGIDQLLADRLVTSRILSKIALYVPDNLASQLRATQKTGNNYTEWPSGAVWSGHKDEKPSVIQGNDDMSETVGPLIKLIEQTVGGAHGVSYQTFARDVEKSNMASARVNTAQDRAEFRRLQERFIDTVLKWNRSKFMDAVVRAGYLKKFNVNLAAYTLNYHNFQRALYQPNGFDMIDPKGETAAALDAIDRKAGTKQAWFAKFGTTHKKAMNQIKREQDLERKLFGDVEQNKNDDKKEKKETDKTEEGASKTEKETSNK